MIKDYYKIFGVSEDAPEQEIRARWIELMKHFHPDVQKGMEFDEISKEINEAYQVLKDPFSRADYDHNLAQHRYYRKKRVGHRLGFFLLGSILFIAIIYMAITPSKTSIPSVSRPIHRSVAPPQTEKEVSRAEVEVKAKVKQSQPNPINPSNPTNPINKTEVKVEVEKNHPNPSNPSNTTNPINQVKAKVQKSHPDSINPTNPSNPINPITQVKAEVKVEKSQPSPKNPINPSNPSNPSNPTNPSIAREEEIKKFFANYVDRYNRKDISGFISFFSNRATQNEKYGLEEIKKIYNSFFNQSLELKYRMSDLKIEIYQNAVNVNAQYELDQIARNGRRNAFKGRIRWVLAREGGGLKIVSVDYQQTKGESHEI